MVLLVLLCMLSACTKKEVRHRAGAIADRAAMPALEGNLEQSWHLFCG